MFDHITSTEWAYLAGIIDGDGYIGYVADGKGGHHTRLMVDNTNIKLLDWIKTKFGGSVITYTSKNPEHKTKYRWNMTDPTLRYFMLMRILPYLIIKRDQAQTILAHTDSGMTQEEVYQKMHVLNMRGV